MSAVVDIRNLFKRYGEIQALDGANLAVEEGKVHGLFGANGAGKSTMIRILTGVTQPDSGSVWLKGVDVVKEPTEARGYCTPIVEIPFLYKNMRLYDMLRFYCELKGTEDSEIDERMEEAVYLTGTGDIIEKRYGKMSLGQQHRSEVARAIATANDVLLMDEPFIGIDVDTKRQLKIHFKKWVKEKPGRAILFTSHNLMENEGFVDRLTFIMKGRTVETGTVDYFKSRYLKPTYIFHLDNIMEGILVIQTIGNIKVEKTEGSKVWVSLESEEQLKELNKTLTLKDIGILDIRREGSVEDVFSHIKEVVE